MEKQQFIEEELARLLRDWFIKAALLGAAVFLLLSPLDFVSVPSRASTFLLYRLVGAASLIALSFVARRFRNKRVVEVLAFLAILISAVLIEAMILQFGGHHSPYYAGMILLAVIALGFFPAGIRFHLLLASTIYLVYLLPILLTDDIHDVRTFFAQNYFLLFILGAGIIIRHVNTSNLIAKIGLNFEVSRQQESLEKTVQERTAKLIQASDEWRITFDSTEDMMTLVDERGMIIKANKALAAFFRKDVRDLVGTSSFDLFSAEALPAAQHPFTLMGSSGRRAQLEFFSTARDRWFFMSAEPLKAGHLRKKGAVLIMRDITGLKILEKGLLESKEEWEETFNIIEDGISIHDEDHHIVQANAATKRILNAEGAALEGRKCFEVFHGAKAPVSGCPGCEARRSGRATTVDMYEPSLGKYLEITALPKPASNGKGGGVIHVVRDITERKEAMDEISRAYRRMKRILEMAPFGIFIVNIDGRIEYANSAINSISGMPQDSLAGCRVGDLPGCREIGLGGRIRSAFGGNPFRLGPVEFQCHHEGEKSVGHFTGVPIEEAGEKKVLVFVDDVTGLKQAEEERSKLQSMLMETQKMESIGTLAGGIAHDFNNILTAIVNYASLSLMKLPEGDPVRKYVSTILASGEKAAGLTRQLLTFSRRQPLQLIPVDLNAAIEEHVKMLRRIIGEDIALEIDLHRPLKKVLGDSGKIEQILLNLAVNASDAMPRGGTLTVETGPADMDSAAAARHRNLTPGSYVRLRVKDTGHGMSPEVQKRIFEPFFTTKKTGEGTGLGLATVYGIVKQHSGAIEVRSEEGAGAEFSVFLPVTLGEEALVLAPSPVTMPEGRETILVVDDEKNILESMAEVLSTLGYSVLTAGSGEKALDLLATHGGKVDLLLSDIIMSGMDGHELAREVAKRHPAVKVLFMSGYAPEKLKAKGLENLTARTLDKPVKIEDLSVQIRAALDDNGKTS